MMNIIFLSWSSSSKQSQYNP